METLFDTGVWSAAVLSGCGKYRYSLTRTWEPPKPVVCWIMLNPSTADAERDDQTIRKVCSFSRAWGAGGIVVVNLFALRATDPAEMLRHPAPIGTANDDAIRAATEGRRIIAAWGVNGSHRGRDREVLRLLAGRPVECLKVSKDGHPWHPLYVAGATAPIPFTMKAG